MGLSFIRVDEQELSTRKSYGGLVSGIGAEVNVSRHVALAPEVRVNYPWDFWALIHPYDNMRFSLRPSIGARVALLTQPAREPKWKGQVAMADPPVGSTVDSMDVSHPKVEIRVHAAK
jgi:hypothetical protein